MLLRPLCSDLSIYAIMCPMTPFCHLLACYQMMRTCVSVWGTLLGIAPSITPSTHHVIIISLSECEYGPQLSKCKRTAGCKCKSYMASQSVCLWVDTEIKPVRHLTKPNHWAPVPSLGQLHQSRHFLFISSLIAFIQFILSLVVLLACVWGMS